MHKHTLQSIYDSTWFSTTLALAACVLLAAMFFLNRQENNMQIGRLQQEIVQLQQLCTQPK